MRNVISNTSCLIALSNISRIDLLQKQYEKILITPEVAKEFGESLPDWISVVPVKDSYKTALIANSLDLGESSTIALSAELDSPLLILDDGKAYRNCGVSVFVFRIILKRKRQNL
jgi:predicted nucleic acid-binding protein